jgi:hypothetical protein
VFLFLLINQVWPGMTKKRLKAGAVPQSSDCVNDMVSACCKSPQKPLVQVDISYITLKKISNKFVDNIHSNKVINLSLTAFK